MAEAVRKQPGGIRSCHTPHNQRHYDGPSTGRVTAPPPLGRMGARLRELAAAPVARRSIELCAALAEVAR